MKNMQCPEQKYQRHIKGRGVPAPAAQRNAQVNDPDERNIVEGVVVVRMVRRPVLHTKAVVVKGVVGEPLEGEELETPI